MPEHYWYLLSKRLCGEASADELRQLQEYMHQDEAFARIANEWIDFWHTSALEDTKTTEDQYLRHLQNAGLTHLAPTEVDSMQPLAVNKVRFIWKKLAVAATILLTIGLCWVWLRPEPTSSVQPVKASTVEEVVRTERGSRTAITLPDGSKVHLNADSKIEYAEGFGRTHRELRLTGEAFFDVVKNTALPMIVHTPHYDVRVTGTAFNVRAYLKDAFSETSLIHGSVEITLKDRKGEVIQLKPSEKFRLKQPEALVSGAVASPKIIREVIALDKVPLTDGAPIYAETAWVNNKLVFEAESFELVALRLERWYGVRIILHDAALAKEVLSGAFEGEPIEQAIKYLQFTTPFRYAFEGKTIHLYAP